MAAPWDANPGWSAGATTAETSDLVVYGAPGDGKVPAWNATAGRLEWATPSGGGGASEQSTYDSGNGGNGFEATSGVQTNATWSHVTGGALLGLTDPQNPTVLADGLYYVNCQLLADSTPQNDWGVFLGQGSGGDQDRDFGFLPGGTTMGGVAAISVGAVMALHAGDHIWAAVIATETDDDVFYLTARVIKIY